MAYIDGTPDWQPLTEEISGVFRSDRGRFYRITVVPDGQGGYDTVWEYDADYDGAQGQPA